MSLCWKVRSSLARAKIKLDRGLQKHWDGRLYLSTETSTSATHAFDRRFKRMQRDNAARAHLQWHLAGSRDGDIVSYDYLQQEMARRLVDRLDDIKAEDGFPLALDIGAGCGHLHRAICQDDALQSTGGGIGGVRKLVQLDMSELMLHRDAHEAVPGNERCESYRLVHDEESPLPFPAGTFDLVMSSMAMHWVNDLPTLFKEIARVLKPDGCFLLAMVGGQTLSELRAALVQAELERDGGVSPHVGPFVELTDVGALLQRAGFALPTLDVDTVQIAFPNAFILMEHLSRMGEGNASIKRRKGVSLDTLLAATCIYDEQFGVTSEESPQNREIAATLQIIYAIGWTPHESQQAPSERGSATHKIGDVRVEQSHTT